ncbi:MAG: amidohydrolase family protein [Lachnospiraceae bacterium]|nr:amidohydrolase family protein [Lachnospiraceae bacterium]
MHFYHGDIVFSKNKKELEIHENSYLAVESGKVFGIYESIPKQYEGAPVTDHGRALIIPPFSDLHVHGGQYAERGTGMDLILSDWLSTYTFPEEAKFSDAEYADRIYKAFVDDMIKNGTFHASFYTTIHGDTAGHLIKFMEDAKMHGFVGKVNMDMNSPDYLTEDTEESLKETEAFLEKHIGGERVKPILTPRFAPTCSRELLYGLGRLAKKYSVGMQTHLVESIWEKAEAVRLFDDCSCDAEIYEKAGLLDNGPSILGHFIFPGEDDIRIAKKYNAITVHCPDATNNIIAGIMPAKMLSDRDIKITLGSDVGAGHGVAVYKQVARAVQLSKLKAFYEPENNGTLTFAEAFYMATKEGGEVFGNLGSFEKGKDFEAIVIDGVEDEGLPLSPANRLERFCYCGDDRNIIARYIAMDHF